MVHNLVNFHFFAYLCIRNQAKKTMEKAFVYGMSVAGNNFTDRIEETLQRGISALLQQCHGLFVQQTEGLTTYQLNFLRLLCSGVHSGFTAQAVTETYPLGSKSNIDRIKKALIDKELITLEKDGIFIADCVFELWFKREMM